MQLETTAGNLKSALACLNGIVERRASIPVLGTVKLSGGKLTATDLDIEACVSMPTTGKMNGAAAIDYTRLAALTKHIQPDEAVEVKDEDGVTSVAFNGSSYTLPSLPVSEFPDFQKVEGERTETDNAGLVAAFKRVRFAISTEETRYYLNGIALVEDTEGAAHAVATDGRRMALVPLSFMPAGAKGQIIPSRLISYLCGRKTEPKAVTFQEGALRTLFEFDGLTVASKLIDGTYPDIWRVIPSETAAHFTCGRSPLLAVLRRILAFLDGAGWCGIKITNDGDGLSLSASRSETTVKERIEAECHEQFEAGYNIAYLVDALSSFTGETVTFAARAGEISGSPCILTSENDPLRVILMPMRV